MIRSQWNEVLCKNWNVVITNQFASNCGGGWEGMGVGRGCVRELQLAEYRL